MNSFFKYDGTLNQILSKVMYIVSLNLLFLLCSLPIFTIGASYTAMNTVMLRLQEGDEPNIMKTFFGSFCNNFKKATIVWIGMLMIVMSLGINYFWVFKSLTVGADFIRVILNLVLLGLLILWVYFFSVIAYYDNTIKGYLDFVVKLSVGNLPKTFVLIIIHVLPLLCILYLAQYVTMAVLLLLFCGFSLPEYLSEKILFRLYKTCGGGSE